MAASPVISGNLPTILDDDNWPIWSIRTEGLLITAGLWSVVADGVTPLPTAPAANATQQEQAAYAAELTRTRAESALDRKAKAFIQRHVSNLHIVTVKSADSAQDAWQTLESQLTQSSVARQSQLQQQLSLLRMEPGELVARFYARLQPLLTELEACGCDVSESTIVLAILAALPPEYEGIVERLRYDQTSGDLSVSRIKRVLLQKEADLLTKQMQQPSPSSSSLWAYSSPEKRGASSSGWQSSRSRSKHSQPAREQQQSRVQSPDRSTRDASSHAHLTCNYCAKPGHIMSECFAFDRDQRNRMRTLFSNPAKSSSPSRKPSPVRSSSPARPASPSRGRTQTPGRAAAHSPSRGPTLYTASACSDDDDGDTQMLQPRLNFNSDLYSPFFIDSGHALYVPDSKQNFISVAAATDDGSSFLFRDDTCLIRCNQFGSMLRVNAHKIKNTYILAAVPMPDGPDTDSEPEQQQSLIAECPSGVPNMGLAASSWGKLLGDIAIYAENVRFSLASHAEKGTPFHKLACSEAHVNVIMRELERNGLQGAHIVSMTADSASVNMGGHSGVIAQLNDVLKPLQITAIRAQPCYSHGLHNTLLAGLTALGAGIKAAIEDIASLLAQHWGELSLARAGAKPETPCDTRWASYTTAAASVLRVWRLAGEAVARVVEGQRERSPPWAVTLSGYFKDTDLLLKICVVPPLTCPPLLHPPGSSWQLVLVPPLTCPPLLLHPPGSSWQLVRVAPLTCSPLLLHPHASSRQQVLVQP
ncbi:hypothetical protein QJQ45_000023 [Haematococcus lacustris]|nr:hypothetical protein QJQ45_000023 [Haematococcus lacustris]